MPFQSTPPPAPPSSPSGSAGAGSAVSASTAQTHARQVADTLSFLQGLIGGYEDNVNFKMTGNIKNLMQNAAQGLWSTDRFIQALSKTKEFHQAFPGILNKDGTLRIPPSTYISNRSALAQAAKSNGVALNEKTLDKLMVNQVDPAIANQRFAVEASYTQNAGTWDAFNAELKAAGHKPMNKKAITQFIMGQAPPQFYSLYRDWQARTAAQAAGFQIAQPIRNNKGNVTGWKTTANDLELSRKQELAIANTVGKPGSAAPNVSQLAQMFRDVLPESRIAAAGISKDDLIQYLYGGPKQAQIQQNIDQFMKNTQAEAQDTTTSMTVQGIGQRGLASQQRAQTGGA